MAKIIEVLPNFAKDKSVSLGRSPKLPEMPCQITPRPPIIPAMTFYKIFSCVLLVLLAALAGCVEREMTITSTPEGALVRISDREVGRTPVTIPFTWYGDYEIILRLEGHETRFTHAHLIRPWYEVPPIDLFSELAPWTYRDQRYLHFTLEPRVPTSEEELIARAEQLAQQNLEAVLADEPDANDYEIDPNDIEPVDIGPDTPVNPAPPVDDATIPGPPARDARDESDDLPEIGPTGDADR
jgi:hypothetical protein